MIFVPEEAIQYPTCNPLGDTNFMNELHIMDSQGTYREFPLALLGGSRLGSRES